MSSAATTREEVSSSLQSVPDRGLSVLTVGSLALLFIGPLTFGTVEPWSIFLMESGVGVLVLIWAVRQTRCQTFRINANPLYAPMLAFGALIFLQLVLRETAVRTATLSTGLLYVAYGMLSFLIGQSFRQTGSLKALCVAVSAYGTALATFAMLQGLAPNGKLYWLRTPRFGGWIYGPYVNHNHYAGLMEMLFPVPLVVALSRHAHRERKMLAGFVAMIMASTIFLSESRGGMAALAGQLLLVAAIFYRRRTRESQFVLLASLIVSLGLVLYVGGADLTTRLGTLPKEARRELSGGTRINIDRDAISMFVMKPILGWGLGTFADVYPQYRSFQTDLILDHAHNDYMELLVETGAAGFLIMLWFLFRVYRTAIGRLRMHPDSTDSAATAAAIIGITGILIHSLVDFNLQIPANAAWFYVSCTVATLRLTSPAQRPPVRSVKFTGTTGSPDSRANALLAAKPR